MDEENLKAMLGNISTIGVVVLVGWVIWLGVSTVMNFLLSIIWLILIVGGVSGFMITWYQYYSKANNLPTKKALLNLEYMLKQENEISHEDKVVIMRFLNYCEGVLDDNERMMVIIKDLKRRCNTEVIIDLNDLNNRRG